MVPNFPQDNGQFLPGIEDIRIAMLRAATALRELAAQQTDTAKAAEMRDMADRLEALANEK
jgi:hypothetical protein